jgi:hypothetical protein
MTVADTGCWVTAELDDEGALRVQLYAAALWREGQPPVKYGEEVQDRLPAPAREAVRAALSSILQAAGPSALALAQEAAGRHAGAAAGQAPPRTIQMNFGGALSAEGQVRG